MPVGLIIIDIQNDYFPGGTMELVGSEAAGQVAGRLLDFFRERQWPVVHIQHIATRPGATFFLPGTPGAEIHASVTPLADEPVVEKHFPNSFRDTDLLARLQAANITGWWWPG
jgi:nicotinamidase-related amidase